MTGKLTVIAGPMFSGKTEELVRLLMRAQIAKKSVAVFKPDIDVRYGSQVIMSHSGYSYQQAVPISNNSAPLAAKGNTLIAFDEAQFFESWIVDTVMTLVGTGSQVIVAGLDKDYTGKPFGFMPQLLALADHVTKLTAVCMLCGQDATMTYRTRKIDDTILVGGSESYEARCRTCHAMMY